MSEQQKSTAASQQPVDAHNMTRLEGIRQKVFMDRYSLKDANGHPLEFYPEQLWARVARGIAVVEKTEELQTHWQQRFYEALNNFQFVPGGRILAGAGSGHQVTYYNCMPPDQEVLTANGYRPISEIKIGDLVVTHRNRLRPVLHKFERETEETLYIIRPKKLGYDDLRLTGDHKVYVIRSEWVNRHKSRDGLRLQHEPDWIPAKEIKPEDYVAIVYYDEEERFSNTQAVEHAFEYNGLKWVRINEIAVEEYTGTVLDIEVEEDHSFISAGVVVSNCYVIPSPEDSRQGILDNLKLMTEIMARGGGVGINLSTLRPRGSYIRTVNGTASGPCSWAQLYSVATGDVIQQGGSRRGALMLMLDDNHPDIEEFITVKRVEGRIEHANLSVCVSDAFMEAVKNDADWNLVWQGEVKKTIRARHLWDLICKSAWESAEPGVVFMDRYNKLSNTWYYEDIRCVNPCGEQGLPPFGVCNLGALNLSAFVKNGKMDYERLAEISKVAMRFLDNVIDANEYFIEENRVAQLGTRRTGLGTMGLADALLKMKIAYGSPESLEVIERIYTTIRDAAYEASSDIAVEKGSFPRFERDKYMQGAFIKRLPKHIQEKIKKQGIRNAVLLTQAPTGTTSLFAGVSSGIEPVYDFAMVRRDRTGEHILYHPLLQAWRDEHPNEPTPSYFVAANDLTPEEHVRVQATIQKYTDSSISKTVNAPNSHTVEDVQTLYRLAYELGCKGITYMRDGSRVGVLSHIEEKKPEQQEQSQQEQQQTLMVPVTSIQDGVKPRPPVVYGYTRQVSAPEGKINVTINSDDHGPLEVFVNVGKAGSDIAALAEALGRLISLNLRILSPLSQTDRAREIAEQLRGIGGSRSVGFGSQQVRSLPDAVAKALEMHIETAQQQSAEKAEETPQTNGHHTENGNGSQVEAKSASLLSLSHLSVTGNLCPQCGCNTMVYEEGCRKCYSCGHSEC
ncbi:MAG TPA: adenosylcobalamin-dependent ribonucleoside-diphosphate reductase [Ktedonobacteraceae bacterium]|nr:adenosylcobalamin-dependent ribonucleoside-diphosphate reductase [Ktedonobacteraceae bacterium]